MEEERCSREDVACAIFFTVTHTERYNCVSVCVCVLLGGDNVDFFIFFIFFWRGVGCGCGGVGMGLMGWVLFEFYWVGSFYIKNFWA